RLEGAVPPGRGPHVRRRRPPGAGGRRRPRPAPGARLPATAPADAMTAPPALNVAAPLAEMARRQPDVPALIEPRRRERRWTYRELDAESDRLARGLARLGLARGTRAVLMVPPGLEFYGLTFALFKLGAVVVLIDPG